MPVLGFVKRISKMVPLSVIDWGKLVLEGTAVCAATVDKSDAASNTIVVGAIVGCRRKPAVERLSSSGEKRGPERFTFAC
jgi:hypothetical protein